MKKAGLIAAVAATLWASAPAQAADILPGAPVPTPFAYRWSGIYVGGNLGYQWGTVTNFGGLSPSGFVGGIQAGYNWQFDQFVVGVETDLQLSGADATVGVAKFSQSWFGTTRARAGYAMSNILFYLTAGLVYGGGRFEIAGLSESQTHTGWTVGAGIEVGLTPQWSARAEYLYMDLGDYNYVLTGTSSGLESSLLRMGVNYHF